MNGNSHNGTSYSSNHFDNHWHNDSDDLDHDHDFYHRSRAGAQDTTVFSFIPNLHFFLRGWHSDAGLNIDSEGFNQYNLYFLGPISLLIASQAYTI